MSTATPAVRSGGPLKHALEQAMSRIDRVLPKHLTPERMVQIAATLAYRNPRLQECDPNSIVAAVIQASELGLDISTAMGEAYLIPRYNSRARVTECQFQPGYRGLVKLARQSGEIALIRSSLVLAGDVLSVRYTPDLEFLHEPVFAGGGRREVTHAYAYAKLTNGERLVEVMDLAEIEAIHQRSESYRKAQRDNKPEDGPWATDWGEMARKTALKRICKGLPRSVELARAIEADDEPYRALVVPASDAPRLPGRGVKALEQRLAPPRAEPEFAADQGVEKPLRSEADDELDRPDGDPEFATRGDAYEGD